METMVNTKTEMYQEQEREILAYLNKCSKHLFIDENNRFFKVMLIRVGNSWRYVTLTFDDKDVYIKSESVRKMIEWHGNDAKNVIKRELFPMHYNRKSSIPNFKEMKEKMFQIHKLFQVKTETGSLEKNIMEVLDGLKPKV